MLFVNWSELAEVLSIQMNGYYFPVVEHKEFDEELLEEIYTRYEEYRDGIGEPLDQVTFKVEFTMYNAFMLAITDLEAETAVLKISNNTDHPTELDMAIYDDCLICAEYDALGFIAGFITDESVTERFLELIISNKLKRPKILIPNVKDYLKE